VAGQKKDSQPCGRLSWSSNP